MLARIFSTIVLWTLTITVIVYARALGWTAIVGLLSAAALWESCQIMRKMGFNPMCKAAQTINAVVFVCVYAFPYIGVSSFSSGAMAFAASIAILSLSIVRNPFNEFAGKSFFPTLAALVCIPFMLQWYAVLGVQLQTAQSPFTGIILAVWILSAAKFSDVGAYVVGCAFGRHKMAPSISPQKSWEGAVSGIISSAVISAAIAWGFADILPVSFNPVSAAIGGSIIGAIGIVSDLLESVFKRRAEVKDSGAVIPGIGGALDLADSLILSAPAGVIILAVIL